MKKLVALLVFASMIFASCSSDQGPQGPPGPQGEDGVNILGQTFEQENVNFGYDGNNNLWSTLITFPADVEVFESDAVLVYRFDGQIDLEDGSSADAWSLIPQNFFTAEGTIQYVFSHTFVDVELFIDGNYNLENLGTNFTDDQIFRVVIVPSDFAATVDVTNMSEVMNALNRDYNGTPIDIED